MSGIPGGCIGLAAIDPACYGEIGNASGCLGDIAGGGKRKNPLSVEILLLLIINIGSSGGPSDNS